MESKKQQASQQSSIIFSYSFTPELLESNWKETIRLYRTMLHEAECLHEKQLLHRQSLLEANLPATTKEEMLAEIDQGISEVEQLIAKRKTDVEQLQAETPAFYEHLALLTLREDIRLKSIEGKTPEQIADELNKDIEVIRPLYQEVLQLRAQMQALGRIY